MSIFGRLVRKRRDGDEITYVDYNGERQTKQRAPVLVLYKDDASGYVTARFENHIEQLLAKAGFDVKEYFFDVFLEDGRRGGGGGAPAQGGRARRGRGRPSAHEFEQDDEPADDADAAGDESLFP